MFIAAPVNWPLDAPEYNSLAGWEYEKKIARMNIIKKLTDRNNAKAEMIEKLLDAFQISVLLLEACMLARDYERAKQIKMVACRINERLNALSGIGN